MPRASIRRRTGHHARVGVSDRPKPRKKTCTFNPLPLELRNLSECLGAGFLRSSSDWFSTPPGGERTGKPHPRPAAGQRGPEATWPSARRRGRIPATTQVQAGRFRNEDAALARGAGTAWKSRCALGAKLEDSAWRLVGESGEPDIALESADVRHKRVRDLCRIRSQGNGHGGNACPLEFQDGGHFTRDRRLALAE